MFAAAILLQACTGVLFAGLNSTDQPRGETAARDIVFDPAHHLALDVYAPSNAVDAPVVVFFYGGSWVRGERDWYRFVGTALAAHGIVTVIADYRKVPVVKVDGFMHDAADAVAWTHAHAGDYGGNVDDLFVMGHSAGGQIAALLATDPRWLRGVGLIPDDLAGCIGLAGVYDFVPIAADDDEMLDVFGSDEAAQARADPLTFVHGGEPPMLLLQGTDDDEVEPSETRAFAAALRAHGDDVTAKYYVDVGHSALLFAIARPLREHAPTLADIVAFVHAHPHATNIKAPAALQGPSAAVP